jgi:hypothetical protein|nr:MAG TPA: hypothetical protein [Caudoviricetes sp.]
MTTEQGLQFTPENPQHRDVYAKALELAAMARFDTAEAYDAFLHQLLKDWELKP